jgi:hypothetical protein
MLPLPRVRPFSGDVHRGRHQTAKISHTSLSSARRQPPTGPLRRPAPPPRPSSLSDPLPSRACHHCLLHASSPFGRTDASLATCMLLFLLPALHTATLAPWGSFGRARQLAPPSVPATTAAAGRRMPRSLPNCTSSIYDPLQLSRPIRVAIVC